MTFESFHSVVGTLAQVANKLIAITTVGVDFRRFGFAAQTTLNFSLRQSAVEFFHAIDCQSCWKFASITLRKSHLFATCGTPEQLVSNIDMFLDAFSAVEV